MLYIITCNITQNIFKNLLTEQASHSDVYNVSAKMPNILLISGFDFLRDQISKTNISSVLGHRAAEKHLIVVPARNVCIGTFFLTGNSTRNPSVTGLPVVVRISIMCYSR